MYVIYFTLIISKSQIIRLKHIHIIIDFNYIWN